MNIIMLGAPGAGKGTQAEFISDRYNIPQISTGNIIREALSNGSEIGKEAKSYIESGALVPDSVVIEMVRQRLRQDDTKNGFILDGFPRTVPQAKALEDMGVAIDKVIDIEVADEIILERLSGRRTCSSCGATFHISNNPSSKGNLCDKCGAELTIRKDDKPETIAQRLRVYHEQTEPLKDFYEKHGALQIIDGKLSIEKATSAIMEALEA